MDKYCTTCAPRNPNVPFGAAEADLHLDTPLVWVSRFRKFPIRTCVVDGPPLVDAYGRPYVVIATGGILFLREIGVSPLPSVDGVQNWSSANITFVDTPFNLRQATKWLERSWPERFVELVTKLAALHEDTSLNGV